MKVLVNASTLQRGGALQAFVSFVREMMLEASGIEWIYAASPPAHHELVKAGLSEATVSVVEGSPARGRQFRRCIEALEKRARPDVVFTLFGPAYVTFDAPHLCGVGNPWVVHPSLVAYRSLGLSRELILTPMRALYRAYWFRKADAWVVETAAAKKGLSRSLGVSERLIHVVPNTCSSDYLALAGCEARRPRGDEAVRLLCFTADYPHKNLPIIPYVARWLVDVQPTRAFEFLLTLPIESVTYRRIQRDAAALGVGHCIRNVGPVAVADGPALYAACHVLFLPSVLEVFSANFPEAMAMGRPIVTTDQDFARSICGNAATYFRPMDARSAGSAIISLLESEERWKEAIAFGKGALSELPTPPRKRQMYLDAIRSLGNR